MGVGTTVGLIQALAGGKVKSLESAIGNKPDTSMFAKCVSVTETSPNVFNKADAGVGFLHANGMVYTGGSYDNYRYGALVANLHEGDVVKFYADTYNYMHAENVQYVVAYNSNGVVQPDKGINAVNTYTVPSGITTIKVTIQGAALDHFVAMVNPEEMPESYIPYGEGDTYYVAGEDFIPKSGKIIINVPKKLYALTSYELNVYFENLTEDWTQYSWNCDCDVGKQLERGYRLTPTDAQAGDHTLTISATAKDGTVTKATTTIKVVASSAGNGVTKSIIVLGDSTTDGGIMVSKIAANFSDDVMSVTLKGTRGTSPNFHEGRSGWKFSDYCTKAQDTATPPITNAFWNATSQKFDASYYFSNSGVTAPDWFFINLGINDVFGYTKDSALETQIENCINYCDEMISSILTASPSTNVVVCLTIPPNHSQDAFGKAYSCSTTRDQCKHNNTKWVNEIIKYYDGHESDGVYVLPINVVLDTVNNMGMETDYVNARNTSVTYSSPIANGGVHPVESGYWQIADMFTAFLKANAT